MKIAMIGHKDFPCRSGGVEVVVYELATRLAARGEDVTVYNRGRQRGHNRYRVEGVNVIRSFTFRRQSLNAMVYSFTATLGALRRRYDIMHYHAIGPCVPLVIAHAFGRRTVATVHGLNWRVDKWRGFASKYIKLGERIAAKYADEVITLSDEMHRYFLDTYGPQVFHLIVRMIGSPEDAEELTQDCFMKAFTHLSSFHGDSSFSTWIYRIAYNEAISALRKKDKELLSFDDRMWNSLSDKEIDEELDTENEVQIQKLQQALTQLKPDEQALVTLFYEEEKNIEEIAYIFHLTESNVKVKLHRIRKKLCNLMKEEI